MSDLWKLKAGDFIKGLVLSVITAVLTLILEVLQTNGDFDLGSIGTVAAIAFISYLLKNLGTDAGGNIAGRIKTQ